MFGMRLVSSVPERETISHLFFECVVTHNCWFVVSDVIQNPIGCDLKYVCLLWSTKKNATVNILVLCSHWMASQCSLQVSRPENFRASLVCKIIKTQEQEKQKIEMSCTSFLQDFNTHEFCKNNEREWGEKQCVGAFDFSRKNK